MKTKLGLIVPCYNEEAILQDTIVALDQLFNKMITDELITKDSFITYVDDGSRDKTWEIIANANSKYARGVKLSRNCGHQNALLAGIESFYDKADALITIDADLQDDINYIIEMVKKFQEGCDIVYGVRKKRKSDSFFKRFTAQMFYRLMKVMGAKTIYNHADFRLMSQRSCRDLLTFREKNLFLRGMVPLIGYKSEKVYYDRLPRTKGETKYPLKKMLAFAWNGITSFSNKPIILVRKLGQLGIFFSLLAPIVFLILHLCKVWTPTDLVIIINVIAFATFLIIFCLGIVGEYIGKIYQEVKDRPRYFIETIWQNNTDQQQKNNDKENHG